MAYRTATRRMMDLPIVYRALSHTAIITQALRAL